MVCRACEWSKSAGPHKLAAAATAPSDVHSGSLRVRCSSARKLGENREQERRHNRHCCCFVFIIIKYVVQGRGYIFECKVYNQIILSQAVQNDRKHVCP